MNNSDCMCQNCQYSKLSGYSVKELQCRFRPPKAVVMGEGDESRIATVWPTVSEDDWCGKFKDVIKDRHANKI
jgi:hypothetical protein